jgi:hypothetical protein
MAGFKIIVESTAEYLFCNKTVTVINKAGRTSSTVKFPEIPRQRKELDTKVRGCAL